jgi:hypothetical protein
VRGTTVAKDNLLRPADHGYDRFLQLFRIFEAGFGLDFGVSLESSEATTIIKDNEIEGFGPTIGVYVFGSSGNVFKDNDTAGFVSSDVDFFADAFSLENTTYLDDGQTYFDEVPGNNIWIYDD